MKQANTLPLIIAFLAAATFAGCAKSESSGSEAQPSAASSAASNSRAASFESMASLPTYPGARKISSSAGTMSGSHQLVQSATESFSTKDSFDEVRRWYQSRLPLGSEKRSAGSSSTQTAVFDLTGAHRRRFTIAILGGPTITVISFFEVSRK